MRHLRRLALVPLLALLLAAPVGSAQGAERTAGAAPVLQEHGEANAEGYSCSTGIVIRWAHVKGIDNYTLTFYDGYYQSEQTLFASPPYGDKGGEHEELWAPKGTHQVGWTGGVGFGFGSPAPPCKADAGYYGRVQNPKVHWTEPGSYIEGTVTGDCPPDKPIGKCPVKGVKIRAARKGGARSAAKGSNDTTDRFGNYSLKVEPGSYEVKATKGKVKFKPKSKKVKVKKESAARADFAAEVKETGGLEVDVRFAEEVVNISDTPEKEEPVQTVLQVSVKNTSDSAISGVDLDRELKIEWDVDGVKAPKPLPLEQNGAPTEGPFTLDTLEPGQSGSGSYLLAAKGDGTYKVTAGASGTAADGDKVSGKGSDKLRVRTPLLFMYAHVGRRVTSRDQGKVIGAGTAFAIRVRLQNRSYRETLSVFPISADLAGNASGGYSQEKDQPLVVNANQVDDAGKVAALPYVVLKPREDRELDVVVHTRRTDDAAMLEPPAADGTTSARASFKKPLAWKVKPGDKQITVRDPTGRRIQVLNNQIEELDDDQVVLAEGAAFHEVRVDPFPFMPMALLPSEYFEAVANLAYGGIQGLRYSTTEWAQGLYDFVPSLTTAAGMALGGWLARVQVEVEQTVELFRALGTDKFTDIYIQQVRKNDKQSLEDFEKIGGAPKKILDAMGDGLVNADRKAADIAKNWYEGDWRKSARDLGQFVTKPIADAVLVEKAAALAFRRLVSLAPRLKPVVKGVADAKLAAYRKVAGEVDDFISQRWAAEQTRRFIKNKVKPGFIAKFPQLPRLYGITVKQAKKFAEFAKNNQLIITVRSRAAESLKWLDEAPPAGPAYFKPEFIKIKNVSHYDIEYLGFPESGRGRVMYKKNLPTDEQVLAQLEANKVDQMTRDEVMERLKLRREELSDTGEGFVTELEDFADKGTVTESEFNWKDNGLDPGIKEKKTKARFQMVEDPAGSGTFAIKVELDGKGGYKSVTGDVDIVDITYANGTPLNEADTVKYLLLLREPPYSIQHPYTATWWKKGEFDFDKKHSELSKERPIQFGPDEQARVVEYDKSKSSFACGQFDYRVFWTGGYLNMTSSPYSIFNRPLNSPCANAVGG